MELNIVTQGDYKSWHLKSLSGGEFALFNPWGNKKIEVNGRTLSGLQVLSQNNNINNTSTASRLVNAGIGGAIFGTAGMVAGASTNKQKINTTMTVMLIFKDGCQAVLEVNQQTYNSLVLIASNSLMATPSDSENIDYLTKMKGDYWECRNCGRNNPNSSSRCSCGMSKY